MPDTNSFDLDAEVEAQQLVGKFLQSFALMERALDLGIGKLLGIEGAKTDIVCSNIPFAKKLSVFFSAEGFLAKMPDAERMAAIKHVRSGIYDLNEKRIMFAHSPFSASGEGVRFRRVVASTKLLVSDQELTRQEVAQLCEKTAQIERQLEKLVNEMETYVPSLDFSDPRNSGYMALFL